MPFRLQLHETPQEGVRRIFSEQVGKACRQLEGRDETRAIHESRKCFKRIRTLLKLVRPTIAKSVYRRENARIRDISRALSPFRDIDVMPATLAFLEVRADGLDTGVMNEARRSIVKLVPVESDGERSAEIANAIQQLRKARETLLAIKLKSDTIDAVTAGLGTGLERLSRGYETARRYDHDEDWHNWRKSVQVHWRQLKLFANAWPDALEARLGITRQLARVLGMDHDLSVLANFLVQKDLRTISVRSKRHIERGCRELQRALRVEASAYGELLVGEDPEQFSVHIAHCWRAQKRIAAIKEPAFPPLNGALGNEPQGSVILPTR